YINKYRIEEACRILSDTNNITPLKAISYQLGFNSLTTFYTLFKAAVQMSPDQYRRHALQISNKKKVKIDED
ncbi:MAG: helix-turn-helix domain-containing protein, partial [Odoribacter sp.]|nr:helix-turn-helix domain-containing protein [Odoribacter sp.]